jgi:hypothetical protein
VGLSFYLLLMGDVTLKEVFWGFQFEVYWVIHVKNTISLTVETFLDEIDCLSATNELLHSVILVKDVNDPPLC